MLLSRCSFEGKFLKRVLSSILPDPRSEYVLSNFHPRSVHTEGKPLAILSYHVDEVLIDLLNDIGWYSINAPNGMGGPLILRIVFHKELSHLSGVLGRSADGKSIP